MDLGDIKVGQALAIDGHAFIVTSACHSKMGRGGAVVKTKLRNLRSGGVVDRTIKSGDTFDEADVTHMKATYLYKDNQSYAFMDATTFDQFSLSTDQVGSLASYLAEGTTVEILAVDGQPVSLTLPIKMEFEVTDTPPNVKGNTATGGTKTATISTGATVTVPLFIKKGDIIRVNTQDGSYVERASR